MTAPLDITPARRAKLSSRTAAHVRQGYAVYRAMHHDLSRARVSGRSADGSLADAANTFVALVVDDLKRDLRVRCCISAYIKTATTAVQTGTL